MTDKPAKSAKIYRYMPYNDEESFDKVESSNSRPRTLPGSNGNIKEQSESNSNPVSWGGYRRDEVLTQCEQKHMIQHFDEPKLWSVACPSCQNKISELGLTLGVVVSHQNVIKQITPLKPVKQSQLMSYAVEYEDSRYEKFTSKALSKWHLVEMVAFLQQAAFGEA